MNQTAFFTGSIFKELKAVLASVFLFLLPLSAGAAREEVLLTFRHTGVGNFYVNSLYDYESETVYLPFTELFSLLEINYQPDARNFTVKGNFLTPDQPYSINFAAASASLGKEVFEFSQDEVRLAQTEFYLHPRLFEEIFGLKFTVNINHLMLTLETEHSLPVQERIARERLREKMEGRDLSREDYPLRYGRERDLLDGAMLDYSITGNYSAASRSLGYSLTGGMELLGGDLQGTVYGNHANGGYHSLEISNLRWRYSILDNKYISGITLGQTTTTGLQSVAIRGISITNDPIEPRQMYETYVVDGNTEPESEVELYINDRLSGFLRADELGYYRFDVPLSYGTTRVNLRIFTPSGELIENDKQIQVPFTFLPRGVLSYNVQAGQAEDYAYDTLRGQWLGHANVALGISRWLTASLGTQYSGADLYTGRMSYYGSISARIAKQYLFNLDLAPQEFYRLMASVMYANNLSLNVQYTKYQAQSLFNTRGANDYLNANIYLPFKLFGAHTGVRLGGEHTVFDNSSLTSLLGDFSQRIGKVNLRFNYRENFSYSNQQFNPLQSLLSTTLTYTVSRSPGLPVYIRGMYIRAQNQFDVRNLRLQETSLELSRTVFDIGRLDIGVAYSHILNQFSTRLGLTIDFDKIRSNTTLNTRGKSFTARQSLNGSIGYDAANRHLTADNRQQVGHSALSVNLYVDENNSGHYDEGEERLPYQGVRVDRTARMEIGRDSVLRVKQLMNYYRYNLSVNRDAIADPTLVPLEDEFSFIADPNQHKPLEIAFYRGGIIEGYVQVLSDGEYVGQSGLRLNLRSENGDFQTVVRTMNDGGFYTMDLPPARYTLEVDSLQLGFLNVRSEPAQLNFEIRALSEGDYLEGLELTLIPLEEEEVEASEVEPDVETATETATETETEEDTQSVATMETATDQAATEQTVSDQLEGQTIDHPASDQAADSSALSSAADRQAAADQQLSAEQEKLFSSGIIRQRRGVIAFTFASAELTKESASAINWMANKLKTAEWKALIIYGNADSTGEADYNMALSLKRANAVKAALVSKGVPAVRIRTVGNGENKAFATNDTKEGRRLNRRIDLDIVE